MDVESLISSAAQSIRALAPAVSNLESPEKVRAIVQRVVERGHFTPEQDALAAAWFARYLTARAGLLETIDDLRPIATGRAEGVTDTDRLRCFALAYTAVCLLVRASRYLVEDLATHKLVQRKLNEGSIDHRIPRKQFTSVYKSLTSPLNAWYLAEAIEYADAHRAELEALRGDPVLGPALAFLPDCEGALRVRVRDVFRARLRYRWHSVRRRRASAMKQGLFGIFEGCGRVIADVVNPLHKPRMTGAVHRAIRALLQPGDVIIARHDQAFSNLFLPGYWPHAALYIGPPSTREAMSLAVSAERSARWVKPKRMLEAKKDGVLFRPLAETLACDAVAVLRPQLQPAEIARALTQVIEHEGKLYNFDLDFFTADRLVCTEVIYRAYEGVGGIAFSLRRISGILTLPAEDIIDLAIERRGFEPIALFGTPTVDNRLVTDTEAARLLPGDYRMQ